MRIKVEEISQVGEARRTANDIARALGFDANDVGRAGLVATELATNLVKHAQGGGHLYIQTYNDKDGVGLEILSVDRGPGMDDFNRALRDGHSTAGSAGNGLGAIKRNSDYFDVYTQVSMGTVLMSRIVPRSEARADAVSKVEVGALSQCYPGEIECGDAWAVHASSDTLFVADGLGHGIGAAAAARVAQEIFSRHGAEECTQLIDRIHRGLTPTRGAAIAVARVDRQERCVRYVGVGNIAGSVVSEGKLKKMISHNGTAGHKAGRIAEFTYPYSGEPLVIMHTDGVSSRWDLSQHPGLSARHPSVVAATLFRDHHRTTDDATIAAIRVV